MDSRIFNRTALIWTSDCRRLETFRRGDRVKNVRRMGRGVIFEPVDPYRIAATFTMNWDEFMTMTDAVHQAKA